MKIINTEEEFRNLINNEEKVVIDFYADWCGPCKMMAPFFEEAANEVTGITFAKVNVDHLEKLSEEFEISSIPTLIVFEKGQQSQRHAGFLNKTGILDLIK